MLAWIGATSGSANDAAHNYNNPANWAGGVIDDSFSGVTFTANTTLYLSANRSTTASGLNLNYSGNASLTIKSSSATTRTLQINGDISGDYGGANAQAVTIGDASAPVNVNLNGNRTIEVSGALDTLTLQNTVGGGGLAKDGSGTLELIDANTYFNGTTLNSGTIRIHDSDALGSGDVELTAGVLESQNVSSLANNVVVTADEFDPALFQTDGTDLTLTGNLSGSGGVEHVGDSDLILAGNNSSFSGFYHNAENATRFANANAGSAAGRWNFFSTTGSTFEFSNGSINFGTLFGNSPLNPGTGHGNVTIVTGQRDDQGAYFGLLSDGTGGPLSLTKTGSLSTGRITISGSNTYSGGTTIEVGQLDVLSAGALGSGAVTLAGGQFGTVGVSSFPNNFIAATGTSSNVRVGTGNSTLTGNFSGSGSVTRIGTGSLFLAGNNSGFTGTFTSSSPLRFTSPNAGSASGTWVLNAAANTLDFNSGTIHFGALSGSGPLNPNSGFTNVNVQVGAKNTNTTYTGNISGSLSITKVGSGTFTISGNKSYTLGTTINSGTVQILNSGSLGSGAVTMNGGTLQTSSVASLANNIAVAGSSPVLSTNGATLNHTGSLSGTGTLYHQGTSDVILSGNNSGFAGTWYNIANSTRFGSASSGSAAANWLFWTGSPTLFDFSNGSIQFGAVSSAAPIRPNTGFGNVELVIGNNSGTSSILYGVLSDGTTGPLSVTKVGTSSLTVYGNNTYTGGTTINDGTVFMYYSSSGLGTGTITLAGGTLNTYLVSSLANNINVTAGVFSPAALQTDGANLNYTGSLQGNGYLEHTGTTNITLSGNNTSFAGSYSNIAASTRFANANAGSALAAWSFTSPAESTFEFGNGTISFGTLFGTSQLRTNVAGGTVVISVGARNDISAYSGTLNEDAAGLWLLKTGTNMLVLAGNNQHSNTIVASGSVDITNASAVGVGDLTLAGGEFATHGVSNFSNATIVASPATSSVIRVATGNLTITSDIVGSGTITRTGTGSLFLGGDNTTFTGTFIASSPTRFLAPYAGSATASWVFNSSSNTIDFSNNTISFGALSGSGPLSPNSGAGASNVTVSVGALNTNTTYTGNISGSLALVKVGTGSLTLTNNKTYANGTTINGGSIIVTNPTGSATGTGAVTINNSGTLSGSGRVSGSVTVNSGGSVTPGTLTGTAVLSSGSATFSSSSTFNIEVNTSTAGSGYDQLNVTGSVNLGNATLSLSGSGSTGIGDEIIIINNDGSEAVTGTFNGLAEGAIVTIGGTIYSISYVGGTGNDVVLYSQVDVFGVLMTGGEKAYQPNLWNDGGSIQFSNNCYNYALDARTGTFAQPGDAGGNPYSSITVAEIRDGAVADGCIYLGLDASDTWNLANLVGDISDYYIVAMVVDPNTDFHWYRHGQDGKWTHKPGGTPVTNLDASGNEIANVETANRNYGFLNYSDFGGYFAVPKVPLSV